MNRLILFGLMLGMLYSCKEKPLSLSGIEGRQLAVSDSIQPDAAIQEYIKPFKENIDRQMDSVLAYAPKTLSKGDSEYNTAIGNMMADAVMEFTNPVFKQRTGKEIDAVLLNHGGIRSILREGPVTMRAAFEIMPFENSVVVVEISSEKAKEMFDYLKLGKAHPISGMQITLNKNGSLQSATLGNENVTPGNTYFIATNDYLQQGGDGMDFLADPVSLEVLDYKIRNVLIDYFKRYDTIAPVQDKRFIKISN